MTAARWRVDSCPRAIPTLRADLPNQEHELTLLFLGDLHWDHALCNRAALKRVLTEALERNAAIILLGDQLCAMQGTNDKRSRKSALRPEHKVDAYFSAVVDDFAGWWEPYAASTWLALEGNHESSVRSYHEVDLTRLWVSRLNAGGACIQYPGYSTYARVMVTQHTRRSSVPFFVHHGHGGGGEVTRGAIQAQRRAVLYPDAHFVVTGHVHSAYQISHEQWRVNSAGRPFLAVQEHVSTGTWKDEFGRGAGGWWVERGGGPRHASGWWCRFRVTSRNGDVRWSFEKAT